MATPSRPRSARTFCIFLLLCGLLVQIPATSAGSAQGRAHDPGSSLDAPEWRVGDSWVYASQFGAIGLLENFGLTDSSLRTLTGDTAMEVTGIAVEDINGSSWLTYTRTWEADYDSGNNGARLQGTDGRLFVEMDSEEKIRVSDFASLQQTLDFHITFCGYNLCNIGFAVREVDVKITTIYDPGREFMDFPIAVGEIHALNYTSDVTISVNTAASDLQDIVGDTESPSSTVGEVRVVSRGAPPIGYAGCNDAYNLTQYDINGTSQGIEWWCPEARSQAWLHTDTMGLLLDFKLKSYTPLESSNSEPSSDSGRRNGGVEVELQFPTFTPNADVGVWINVTDDSGNAVSGAQVQFIFEAESEYRTLSTEANGSIYEIIDLGRTSDWTATDFDVASHGIVAFDEANIRVGVATTTLSDDVVDRDLALRSEGIVMTRIRGGTDVVILNELGIAPSAIPGDHIELSIPVRNLGLLKSPKTVMTISLPDGSSTNAEVPVLNSQQEVLISAGFDIENRSEVTWTIDVTASITIPSGISDHNSTNNGHTITFRIGTLPTLTFTVQDGVLTFEDVRLDATASLDADGGDVQCKWEALQMDDLGNPAWNVITYDECLANASWPDNGEWKVRVTVTDDELEDVTKEVPVIVLNRPPTGELSVNQTNSRALESLRFDVINAADMDTPIPENETIERPPVVRTDWSVSSGSGAVSYCSEKQALFCKWTPLDEGGFTVHANIKDEDDGETHLTLPITVGNALPKNPSISLEYADGSGTLAPDSETGALSVLEDTQLRLLGTAEDTPNDIPSLGWTWTITHNPNGFTEDEIAPLTLLGPSPEFSLAKSGKYSIQLTVSDEEGSVAKTVQLEIINQVPIVKALTPTAETWEGEAVTLEARVEDTASDLESLVVCWDFNPDGDKDGDGLSYNDCDQEAVLDGSGMSLAAPMWDTARINQAVIFHATDDDGAIASVEIIIQISNLPPTVSIEIQETTVEIGSTISLKAVGIDSASDLERLRYFWDLEPSKDENGDGVADNDLVLLGPSVEISADTLGTFRVLVVVKDDDQAQAEAWLEYNVTAVARQGVASYIFTEDGQVNSILAIGIVSIVVVAILLLLVTGRRKSSDGLSLDGAMASPNMFDAIAQGNPQAPPLGAPPAFGAPAATQPVTHDPYVQHQVASQWAAPAPQPVQQPTQQQAWQPPAASYQPQVQPTQQPVTQQQSWQPPATTVQQPTAQNPIADLDLDDLF